MKPDNPRYCGHIGQNPEKPSLNLVVIGKNIMTFLVLAK